MPVGKRVVSVIKCGHAMLISPQIYYPANQSPCGRRHGMATALCYTWNWQPSWTDRNIMGPVLALTQNEGPPFCCSRRPAPVAASGTQDPRPLPLSPAGPVERETRMAATPVRLFATCRVLGLRGEKRVQNKPRMVYGFLQTPQTLPDLYASLAPAG